MLQARLLILHRQFYIRHASATWFYDLYSANTFRSGSTTTSSSAYQSHDLPEGDTTHSLAGKQQLLRQLLRSTHAAEGAMARVLAAQQVVMHNRPDAAHFAQQEREALYHISQLLPKYRVRPSALLSVLQAAGTAAGIAAALAPTSTRNAVIAALQESLTQLYNDQLRTMRELGLSDEAPDVRPVILKLRNLERAAEGAQPPPDILALRQPEAVAAAGVPGLVGAVVKTLADAAVAAAARM